MGEDLSFPEGSIGEVLDRVLPREVVPWKVEARLLYILVPAEIDYVRRWRLYC